MKQTIERRSRTGAAGIVAAGFLAAVGLVEIPAGAVQLTVKPSPTGVGVNGAVEVSLLIEGLGSGGAPSLGAFDVSLTFDPNVLTYQGTAFGDASLGNQLALMVPSLDGSSEGPAGKVNLYTISQDSIADLNALQADVFVLARLSFVASGLGTSSLGLTDIVLADADGNALAPDSVTGARVSVNGANTVPDGGLSYPAFFLAAFGAGCGWVRRRRMATADPAGDRPTR